MTRHATARLAGLLYLATLPTAGFAYGFVAFMPKEDPAALVTALEAGRQALGWTILLGAAGFIDYLLIATLFHRLLAPAGKVAADLLVLFVTASVPLAFAALAQRMELIAMLDAESVSLMAEAPRLVQREANLFQLAAIFWGLWMIPLGWLSYRSGLVPRTIRCRIDRRQLWLRAGVRPADPWHRPSVCRRWCAGGGDAGQRVRVHVLADRQGCALTAGGPDCVSQLMRYELED